MWHFSQVERQAQNLEPVVIEHILVALSSFAPGISVFPYK